MKLRRPNLSINGTKPRELIDSAIYARQKLIDAEVALRVSQPHPRDYQSGSMTNYHNARAAWAERIEAIQQMQEDLYTWAIEVQEMSK